MWIVSIDGSVCRFYNFRCNADMVAIVVRVFSRCCYAQTLPKGISALRNLHELDLEGNRLEYLATEISESFFAGFV